MNDSTMDTPVEATCQEASAEAVREMTPEEAAIVKAAAEQAKAVTQEEAPVEA